MREVTYEDAEKLRERIGLKKTAFIKYLGVERSQYWRWKRSGVDVRSQRLLEVFIAEPGMVVEILSAKG